MENTKIEKIKCDILSIFKHCEHCVYCFADKYGKVSDLVRVLKAWRSRATQRGDDDDDKTVSCSSTLKAWRSFSLKHLFSRHFIAAPTRRIFQNLLHHEKKNAGENTLNETFRNTFKSRCFTTS